MAKQEKKPVAKKTVTKAKPAKKPIDEPVELPNQPAPPAPPLDADIAQRPIEKEDVSFEVIPDSNSLSQMYAENNKDLLKVVREDEREALLIIGSAKDKLFKAILYRGRNGATKTISARRGGTLEDFVKTV